MATLRRDNRTGYWHVRFYWQGEQQQRSCHTKRRPAANRALGIVEDTIHLLKTGRMEMPNNVDPFDWIVAGGKLQPKPERNGKTRNKQFGQVCDAYLQDQRQKQPTTICTEKTHIRHLKRLLKSSTPMDKIALDALRDYRRRRSSQRHHGKPISDVTIKKELVTFRQIWTWAKQNDYAKTRCPLVSDGHRWKIHFEKPNAREKFKTWQQIDREIKRGGLTDEQVKDLWHGLYLDQAQVRELLDHVKPCAVHSFIYPMFAFAAYTGARRSEILRSQIDDFDFDASQITIRERKRRKEMQWSTRLVPLHPNLRSIMKTWFNNHPGGRFTIQCPKLMPRQKPLAEWRGLNSGQAHHHFKFTLKDSKWTIVAGFHVFRHSFGSNLIRTGKVSSDVVAKWMGHTTMEMRELYQHLFPQDGVGQISVLP